MTRLRLAPFVIGLFLVVAAPTPAEASACPATPPQTGVSWAPQVALTINHAPVRQDFTRTAEDLALIIARHGSAAASSRLFGRRVHGLTHSSLGYHLGASFDLQSVGDGIWCLWPRRLEADLGYSETTVYVANTYTRGSCPFNAVLAHEQEHVVINKAVVADHTPRLLAALTRLGEEGFPMAGADPLALREAARVYLDDGFRAALDPLLVERALRNAAIDSEPAYRALNSQCERWEW